MDSTACVGVVKGGCDLTEPSSRLLHRERAVREDLAHVLTVDELEDDVELLVVENDVVDGGDIRMRELGERLGFLSNALGRSPSAEPRTGSSDLIATSPSALYLVPVVLSKPVPSRTGVYSELGWTSPMVSHLFAKFWSNENRPEQVRRLSCKLADFRNC